jgi:ribosome biogenesis GTPase
MQHELNSWGWNPFFENQITPDDAPLTFARVIETQRGKVKLAGPFGERWGAPSGKLRFDALSPADLPAAGDWALVQLPADGDAVIERLLARRGALSRRAAGTCAEEQPVAVNVDVGFVVASLNRDLNPRRIERYLSLVHAGGVQPVILLSKSDLAAKEDREMAMAEISEAAPGVAVHIVSAATGEGLDGLRAELAPGITAVLLGSSGAGKSTLVNALAGEAVRFTQSIRHGDDKGRHTTTARTLIPLPSGALLIDTPGLRELQLWDSASGVAETFGEIAELAAACRFRDCRHQGEPGCNVLGAIERGDLREERLASYHKLGRETAFELRRTDKAAASAAKKKWAKLGRAGSERLAFKRGGF